MPKTLPYHDGELFVARMEQALDEGDIEFLEKNMPRLERLIERIGDRQQELAEIAYRAMQVRAKHEPSGAGRRRPG